MSRLPLKISWVSLALECLWTLVLFPVPMSLDESRAFERAALWGIAQVVTHFGSGFSAWMSPVVTIVSFWFIAYWQWFIRQGLRAVAGDKQLFDAAWQRIQAEERSTETMDNLQRLVEAAT